MFPVRMFPTASGGGGGVDPAQLAAYALKTDLPDISGKADTTYVDTQLGLKADTSAIPDISGKADTTYVDTQLALKVNTSDFNVSNFVTMDGMTTWLNNYLNTNPNSWANLRAALIYAYSLLPTIPLTLEFLPRTSSLLGISPDVTGWSDTVSNDEAYQMPFNISASHGTLAPATATYPLGILKSVTCRVELTWGRFTPCCTWFFVYSWPATVPAASACYFLGNTPVTNLVRPSLQWTRQAWQLNSLANGWKIVYMPTMTDTALNTPYVVAASWDFRTDPPRLTLASHGVLVEHIGTNATSTVYTVSEDTYNISTTTGVSLPYWADVIGGNPTNNMGVFGRTDGISLVETRLHYTGVWQNKYLNIDEMWAVHSLLRARYCTAPFDRDFLGLLA